jgi:hypothetical protein
MFFSLNRYIYLFIYYLFDHSRSFFNLKIEIKKKFYLLSSEEVDFLNKTRKKEGERERGGGRKKVGEM